MDCQVQRVPEEIVEVMELMVTMDDQVILVDQVYVANRGHPVLLVRMVKMEGMDYQDCLVLQDLLVKGDSQALLAVLEYKEMTESLGETD